MLNLNQSSLMIEGSLRGILSSQEGKSFEEIISFSKYIMEENKVAKLSEEIYKPDVEMNVDGIVDILITNIEMKWTEDDIFKIEESELFNDITKMNERNAVKVNNELARKRIRDAKQKAESKKVDEQKQPKQEKAKEEKKAEPKQQKAKEEQKKQDREELAAIIGNAVSAALAAWSESHRDLTVQFSDTPEKIFGEVYHN